MASLGRGHPRCRSFPRDAAGRVTRLKGTPTPCAPSAWRWSAGWMRTCLSSAASTRRSGPCSEVERSLCRWASRTGWSSSGTARTSASGWARATRPRVLDAAGVVRALALEAIKLGGPVIGYDHGGVGEVMRWSSRGGWWRRATGAWESIAQCAQQRPVVERTGLYTLREMQRATIALYEGVARG